MNRIEQIAAARQIMKAIRENAEQLTELAIPKHLSMTFLAGMDGWLDMAEETILATAKGDLNQLEMPLTTGNDAPIM